MVEYKTEHNIVETGGGQLIKDQRVADLSAKLNAARDETLKAKARFDQLAAIGGAEDAGAVGKASIANDSQNDILSQLRSQYFDVSSKEVDLSTKLGLNNPIIVSLRNQKAQLRSEILEEIQRLKQSSKSDYEAAQLRQDELKKEFEAAVFQSQTAKQAQVKLQELEVVRSSVSRLVQYLFGSLQRLTSASCVAGRGRNRHYAGSAAGRKRLQKDVQSCGAVSNRGTCSRPWGRIDARTSRGACLPDEQINSIALGNGVHRCSAEGRRR